MNKRDRYQFSALFDDGNWTPLYEVPWGESPVFYVEHEILPENPRIKEVSIYRNRRFIRTVRSNQS